MSAEASLVSNVVPIQGSFFPGETFRGTWEVAYPALPAAQTDIYVRDVRVDVTGTEHVDPKWVSSSYHGNEPVVHTSARRVARHIFSSHGYPDLAQMTLHPGEQRRIAIRCMLPRQLPPSFHGSAVRFSYTVVVTYRAEFAPVCLPMPNGAAPGDSHDATPSSHLGAQEALEGLNLLDDALNNHSKASDVREKPRHSLHRQGLEPPHSAAPSVVQEWSRAANGATRDSTGALDGAGYDSAPLGVVNAARAVAGGGAAVHAAEGPPWATRSCELTDETSPAALMQASPPVFASPTTPETLQSAPIASPVKKLHSPSKSGVQVISQPTPKTTIRATFKVAISPPDSLPTVPEFEDGESGTPRGGAGGSLGSGPLKSLQNMHSMAFMGPGGPVDPVKGPMIDFWMLSEDESAPVEVEVLPTLPIGAERHMWSGPAAGGRFFLWAPNEVEDVASGPASGLSARVGASYLARSTADLTNATSIDGDSVRDALSARDICGDSENGLVGHTQVLGSTSVHSQGSTQTSPRAARIHAGLSEAGTPRVASSRERPLPPDLRAFSLSFQGCTLACIELHTPADSPLQPGMTFSGTVDFGSLDSSGPKKAVCRQVALLLESEEQVAREWLRPGRLTASSVRALTRRLYHECQDVTCDALFTSFMFTVPLDAPPAFRTSLVSLRWYLRFELTVVPMALIKGRTGAKPAGAVGSNGSSDLRNLWEARAEQLVWRMPLPVVPAGGQLGRGS